MPFLSNRVILLLCVLAGASPGRAQLTEWTDTVAPGKFLLEMDALSFSIDRDLPDDGKYSALGVASTFLTIGVTRNLDVQIGADLFLRQHFTDRSFDERQSGVGDVYLRTKWRFWTNEGGAAAAFLPYVKLPTNSGGVGNDSVEGGFVVPVSWPLGAGFDFNSMAGWDLTRNEADDGYDSHLHGSAVVSWSVVNAIGAYAETAVRLTTASASDWEGTVGAGVTLQVREGLWWDFAVYRGLSRAAPDWNPVVRFNCEF